MNQLTIFHATDGVMLYQNVGLCDPLVLLLLLLLAELITRLNWDYGMTSLTIVGQMIHTVIRGIHKVIQREVQTKLVQVPNVRAIQ